LANWKKQIPGHQQITDAYLLALTIHHHGKLATLDKRLMALVDGGSVERAHLELIE
jgi:predicted nucleic acid-binding protein